MSIELALQEIYDALSGLGIPISKESSYVITLALAVLVILFFVAEAIKLLLSLIAKVKELLSPLFYNADDKDFVQIRNVVTQHLIYEVQRLNREADWNNFYYTDLEAEVEVDPALNIFAQDPGRFLIWCRSVWSALRGMTTSSATRVEKNLIRAIMRSRSRAFLIIGDPGSGKTVSLRQLFLRMAEKSAKSKNKSTTVPLYLNLKHLDVPPDGVSPNTIHEWIIRQIETGQDRIIHNFLEDHFEAILTRGGFFFIFDSFDEIPAVMDAYEEGEIVQRYAKALDDFLHGPHSCRGLVCSRPYRAPKIFMGQRMTIRPLSPKLVKRTLRRYLIRKKQLAQQVWHEMVRERDDLLHVIRTPFYLALLAKYVETNEQLPRRHYELFEEFVTTRAMADEERLAAFILTPDELLEKAGRLAFEMTNTPNVGLEVTVPQAQKILPRNWVDQEMQLLVDALHYSKLGRVSPRAATEPQTFSFAHRRFQEYFAARYLRKHPKAAPFEDLAADNRWREVLVLLCEVLPADQLGEVIEFSQIALAAGLDAPSGTDEHRQAIEAMRFLKDGFQSRLGDLPHDVRVLAAGFIERQFESDTLEKRLSEHLQNSPEDVHTLIQIIKNHLASNALQDSLTSAPPSDITELVQRIKEQIEDGDKKTARLVKRVEKSPTDIQKLVQLVKSQLKAGNLLDQKRAVENLVLADEKSAATVLDIALDSDSDWIQETALRSCRVLATPSDRILQAIRRRLRRKHFNLELFGDFPLYRVLFSSPASFRPLLQYLWILEVVGFLTIALYLSVVFFFLIDDLILLMSFLVLAPIIGGGILRQLFLGNGLLALMCLLYLILSVYKTGGGNSGRSVPAAILLIVSPSIFAGYLATNYPASLSGWVLLPFRMVTSLFKGTIKGVSSALHDLKASVPILVSIVIGIAMMGVMMEASEAMKTCGNSLRCLYDTCHPIIATLAILIWLLFIPLVLLLVLGVPFFLWYSIRDPVLLRYLSLNSSARPTIATQAVERLKTFKADSTKVQYLHNLRNWLPISSEWKVFVEEANNHKGAVRDELYKLAELWQDSQQSNGGGAVA